MPRVSSLKTSDLTYGKNTPAVRSRLRELILYIANVCESDPHFGSVKLNKILWFADTFAFRKLGESITGAEYQKLPHGPAPKVLIPVIDKMLKDHELHVRSVTTFDLIQKRPIALREASLAQFTGEEIAIVDQVIAMVKERTAQQISDLSHGAAWQVVAEGKLIPYEVAAFLASEQKVTETDHERAQAILERLESGQS